MKVWKDENAGLSVSAAAAIIFTGFLFVFSVLFIAITNNINLVSEGMEKQQENLIDKEQTKVQITNTTYNNITLTLTIKAKNVGGIVLDSDKIDVLVDGVLYTDSIFSKSINGVSRRTWAPGETLVIKLSYPTEPSRIKLITGNGVASYNVGITEESGSEEGDTTPPATITDLSASTGSGAGEVDLTWTAPGDDGNVGTATYYVIKYSSSPITTLTEFFASDDIPNPEPIPSPAGTTENFTVTGLPQGVTYYFAIIAYDEEANHGDVSNSPSATSGTSVITFFSDDMESGENGWTHSGDDIVVEIFSDNFETNDLSKWTTVYTGDGYIVTTEVDWNSKAHSGSYGAFFYDHDYSDGYIEKTLDLTPYASATLSYYWAQEDLEAADHCFLDIYDGSWHLGVKEYGQNDGNHATSPSDYTLETIDLTVYNFVSDFKIRFRASDNSYYTWDLFLLDDVIVTGVISGDLWHQTTTEYHSSTTSWWCANSSTEDYVDNMNNSLVSPSIDLTGATTTATLYFWHDYTIITGDSGIVEISTDNSTWTQLATYSGNSGGWTQVSININAYIGNTVNIRFRMVSDSSSTSTGWYIDDVEITGY